MKAGAAPSKWLNRLSRYIDGVPIGNHQTAGNSILILHYYRMFVNPKRNSWIVLLVFGLCEGYAQAL